MRKADILIDIGNTIAVCKPSKTFEYISTGRPIIYFYSNGLIDELLLRYPLALQIDRQAHSPKNAVGIIEGFCLKNKGKRISMEEIRSLYPEHTRESIKTLLKASVTS